MKRMLTVILSLILIAGAMSFIVACKGKAPVIESPDVAASENPPADDGTTKPAESLFPEGEDMPNPIVTIEMDNGDIIKAELLPQYAPNTVASFVSLVQKGYYDGLSFHRIAPTFVIQGGDPNGDGSGGPGYTIAGEFYANGFPQNKISHTRGILSMARTSQSMDSAGSQFFIVVDDAAVPSLDNQYAAFGAVLEGMDVVDQIVAAATLPDTDTPVEPRVMKTVTVDTLGTAWPEPITVPEA